MMDQTIRSQAGDGCDGGDAIDQQATQDGPANGNGNSNGNSVHGIGPNGGPPVSRWRRSQYAEAIENPPPQLATVAELEVAPTASPSSPSSPLSPGSPTHQLDTDDTPASSTRAVVAPDNIGDSPGSAVVYLGEEPSKWRKYRTPLIIALSILVVVLIGTIVGVIVSNSNKNRSVEASPSASMSTTPISATVTSTTGSSSTSSSSTAVPTSSSVPSECADSSKFLTHVSFMGIKDAPGGGGWKTSYYGNAKDSTDCCSYCYKSIPDGCDSWAYLPSSGFAGTACAMIVGWDTGDGKDKTCPNGRGASVYLTTDSDNSTDVGAAGPCGEVAD